MIFGLFGRRPRADAASALYEAIVAQSRRAVFYTEYCVPDSVDGRFDLIVLHQALLVRRLGREQEPGRVLAQEVFDVFCRDLDGNLREMGVGDLAVPKEMQRFGAAFYGRLGAYEQALASDGDDLATTVGRNVLAETGLPSPQARRLAAYTRAAVAGLDAAASDTLMAGRVNFPDPDAVTPAGQIGTSP
jgi:cytochrome b pre-mRNA-processing protein 3